MIIRKLHIDAFGQWKNQSFEFHPGLNIIYGPNESGKTTLKEFIFQLFFGFRSRQQAGRRYEAKDSSYHGGQLCMESDDGQVIILQRTGKKGRGDLALFSKDGQALDESILKSKLYNLDRNWFESLYHIDLENLQEALDPDEMNRYYLNQAVLGSDRLSRYYETLKDQADQLYTPKARIRPINACLDELEVLDERLKSLEEEHDTYFFYLDQVDRLQVRLNRIDQEMEETSQELSILNQVLDQWDLYECYLANEDRMKVIEKEVLDPKALDRWKQIDGRLQELKSSSSQSTYPLSQGITLTDEEVDILEDLEPDLADVSFNLDHQEHVIKERDHVLADLSRLCQEEDLAYDEMKESIEQIDRLKERHRELFEEWTQLDQKIKTGEEKLQLCQSDRVQLLDRQDGLRIMIKAKKQRVPSYIYATMAVFVILIVAQLLWRMSQSLVAVLITIGLLLLLSFFATVKWMKARKQKSPVEQELEENEGQLEEVSQNIHRLQAQLTDLSHQRNIVEKEWESYLEKSKLSTSFTLLEWELKAPVWNHLEYLRDRLADLNQELAVLEGNNQTWFERARDLTDWLEADTPPRQVVEVVSRLLQAKNQTGRHISDEDYLRQEIKKQELATLEKEKQDLLYALQVDSDQEFLDRYQRQEERSRLAEENENLSRQLGKLMECFKKYKDVQAVKEARMERINALDRQKSERRDVHQSMIDRKASIQEIERSNRIQDTLQEFENKKSQLKNWVDEWIRLQAEALLVKNTLDAVQEGYLPKILSVASNFLSKMTQGRYLAIVSDDEHLLVQQEEGDRFTLDQLSTGTKEQVYLSLRLSFLESLTDLQNMPLFIDDGFVNFDPDRRRRVWQNLNELSQGRQVFYFTMDPQVQTFFSSSQIIDLSKKG